MVLCGSSSAKGWHSQRNPWRFTQGHNFSDLDLTFGAVDVNDDLACTSLLYPLSPLPPHITSPPPSDAAGEPIWDPGVFTIIIIFFPCWWLSYNNLFSLLLAAAWNGPANDALAGVCFCSGRAWPCSGAAKVASEMTCFTSRWRLRVHPAGGVAEDASARAMTAGLAFPIVYPLLTALQACTDINASTTLRHDNGNQQRISWVCLHPITNSFLLQKASLVRMRSRINYKRPILIQWLPAMLRSVAAPCLNYAWTRFAKSCSCVQARGWA